MERGFTTAMGLRGGDAAESRQLSRLVFVVAGTPTSRNPIKAFEQGASEEPPDRHYRLNGARCARCGFIELYSDGDPIAW